MSNWLQFLNAEGAVWQNDALSGFTPQTTQADFWLVPMVQHRLLTLSGPDAEKFLQGQLTCDLNRLKACELLLGAHCNVKGRMISSFVIAKACETTVQMRVRADNAEHSMAALKKYLVFSKAELSLADSVPLALVPKRPTPSAQAHMPAGAEGIAAGHFASTQNNVYLHHNCGLQELWLAPEQAQAQWQQLKAIANPAGVDALNNHGVNKGIAEVTGATTEAFLPQMFNYDLLDGISFKKGCYTGQEVIARLHYRGKTKKRTYLCNINRNGTDPHRAVPIGSDISSAAPPYKSLGTVIASSSKAVLITTNTDIFEKKPPLQLADQAQLKLEWATPPYAIP